MKTARLRLLRSGGTSLTFGSRLDDGAPVRVRIDTTGWTDRQEERLLAHPQVLAALDDQSVPIRLVLGRSRPAAAGRISAGAAAVL